MTSDSHRAGAALLERRVDKLLTHALRLDGVALACFVVGFLATDVSNSTDAMIGWVSGGGVVLVASLAFARHAVRRGWRRAEWIVRVRAILSLYTLVLIVVGALTIVAVAIFAMGRPSLGVPAALLALVAETLVLVAAGRSFMRAPRREGTLES